MPVKKSVLGKTFKSSLNKQKKKKQTFTPGGGGFPNGIEFGVAKISSMKIDVYGRGDNKGKPYFMMRGVCTSPKTIKLDGDTVDVAGIQDTLVMEPLFDTPTRARKTEAEHIAYLLWILQEMGVDTDDMDDDSLEDGSLFKAILEDKPHAKFRTWKGEATKDFPDPRVNVQFGGIKNDVVSEEGDDDDVVDETDDEVPDETEPDVVDEAGEEEEEAKPAPKKPRRKKKKVAKAEPEPEPEEDEDEDEDEDEGDEDLEELAKAADANDEDEESAAKIMEAATKAGVSEEDAESAANWVAVVELIKEASGGDDEEEPTVEEEEDEDEEISPAKGETYFYKPPRFKKAVEIEITKVLARAKKVSGKTSKGNTYDNVPFDKLSNDS